MLAHLKSVLWSDDRGQDIAEYAVMLAVILVLVVGTIRLVGSNANNVFSQVGSSLNQERSHGIRTTRLLNAPPQLRDRARRESKTAGWP